MAATSRRRWLAGLILVAVLCTGCNPFLLPFFMMLGVEDKVPPQCKLAADDDDEEVKVVILAYSGLETRPEFLRVDRELSNMLARRLKEGCKQNKEKVTVVPVSQVEKFKDEHPNWQALGPQEIGKHFEADYLIDIEIESLTLYETGSHNTLYRGRAAISLSVIDVREPAEDPIFRKEYTCEYPRSRGPIPAGDSNPQQFRLAFLDRIATDLSWFFTAHPKSDEYHCD